MVLNFVELGRIPYTVGLRLMQETADARRQGNIADTLLLMEHPAVLTLGRNANRKNLLAPESLLAQRGVEIHEVNRGGDVTYHGPGQLVGYLIFDLRGDLPGKRGPHLGPVDFVRLVEEALILSCKDFGVAAQRVPGRTGVWTLAGGRMPERKLAAIGIHVAQGITTHGFALNVMPDLREFDWIVPCGIPDRGVTSLEQEVSSGTVVSLQGATHAVARSFGRLFDRQVLSTSVSDLLGV